MSKRSYDWLSQHPIVSHVVTDREAVTASMHFAGKQCYTPPPLGSLVTFPLFPDDHRMLVSPACGAALAAVYEEGIISDLQKAHKLPLSLSNVVMVVCGGNEVSLELIQSWRESFGITA